MPIYGIWQEKDLDLNENGDVIASEVDRVALLEAQLETVATANAEIQRHVRVFADPTTKSQLAVRLGADNEFQALDENGRPQPVKGGGSYIAGVPLFKGGTAEGWNFWTFEQMTLRDFAESLDQMVSAYAKWVRRQMLAPLFYNGAGFNFTDPRLGEDLTVYGLANGDDVVYQSSNGAATDSHYSAQAAAISDAANPFTAIYNDLIEHPQNGSRIVAFVASDQVAAIRLLAGFAPATRNMISVIPATGDETIDPLQAPGLNLPLASTMTYIGMHENTYIVQWSSLPSGYIVHVAIDAAVKPLALREYPQPALRGLINQGEPMSRFPYQQNNYVAAVGFGGKNRVGAHVLRVGNASYAAPTAYPFPIA
ncbi:MAG TPA: hypothetical protein VGN72_06560 [Tepidisphaeraceae bacterium]|jgi:hypothetical protein|nr:hypothetical protein [Tepidisphaeraceae bacterium]